MISRRFSAWQKAAALAPVLLLMAYLPAEAMLRCRIDGLLRSACCCPDKAEAPSSQAALRAADCCERAAIADHQQPPMAAPRAQDVDHAFIALAAPFVGLALPGVAPPARIDRGAPRYGPAREGPPLVLLKHAFLI